MDKVDRESRFFCVNIRRCLEPDQNQIIGENELNEILSDFSSPKNKDVEEFLKKRAVEFTKKQQSITYLVFAAETAELAGYFSITMKPVTVKADGLSRTARKRLDRVSKYDEKTDSYVVAAYLIAQFGRNYSKQLTCPIRGTELMDIAITTLRNIQYQLGGLLVYLECENHEKLLDFYQGKNGFKLFGARTTDHAEEPHRLMQLMNFL